MKKVLLTVFVFTSFISFSQIKTDEKTEFKPVKDDGLVDEVPFSAIEKVPVYKGCNASLSNLELKKCMTEKIRKHVSKAFNIDKAISLNLEGKQRILTMFKISKEGEIIEAKARASHPALEEEAIRVVNTIPKMDAPGMQEGKPVIVPYSLPIQFQVAKAEKKLTKKEKRKKRKEELLKKVNNKN